ncbi:hypothetical protein, partial [Bacillus licheniformis]
VQSGPTRAWLSHFKIDFPYELYQGSREVYFSFFDNTAINMPKAIINEIVSNVVISITPFHRG